MIDTEMQLAWLKYKEENEDCFESDEEAVFCTWADGYNTGHSIAIKEVAKALSKTK